MSIEKIQDGIGMISDELILDAQKTAKPGNFWKRASAMAIGLSMIRTSAFFLTEPNSGKSPNATNIQLQSTSPSVSDLTTPTIPGVPVNPSTQTGTIQIMNRITPTVPLQGCIGTPINISNAYLNTAPCGISVTARAVEILPGTYSFLNSNRNRTYRIVRMQTINALFGTNIPDEFYFLYPTNREQDPTEFDKIALFWLEQIGYENNIMYNSESGEYKSFDRLLFYTFHTNGIKNGICTSNLYDDSDPNIGKSEDDLIAKMISKMDFPEYANVHYLSELTSSAAIDAISHIAPFENGVYIQSTTYLTMFKYEISELFRRYLNGYPTNETISIRGENVTYSNEKFTAQDLSSLPDLPSALHAIGEAFKTGTITPPHLKKYESLKLEEHSINGWYAKSGDQVYGIIRVCWTYQNEDYFMQEYLDDKYYIIAQASDKVIPVERIDLQALLEPGADDFITNESYNENGRIYDKICV